jgi:hypothetical protein
VSVDSVKYLDAAGSLQTWATDQYVVSGVGGKGRLMPASGVSWPAFGAYPESLIIRFTAGYETVPAPIVQAILLEPQLCRVVDRNGVGRQRNRDQAQVGSERPDRRHVYDAVRNRWVVLG